MKRISLLVRLSVGLLATLLGVTILLVAHARSQNGFSCLVFPGHIVDINGDQVFTPRSAESQVTESPAYTQKFVSPDQRQSAYLTYNPDDSATLALQSLSYAFAPMKIVRDNIDQTEVDIHWTPDSQWLAYYWKSIDHQYHLSVVNAAATSSYDVVIDQGSHIINFYGLSGDGAYLAVGIEDTVGQHQEIRIYSIHNLQLVKTMTLFNDLSGRPSKTEANPLIGGPGDNVRWSPRGAGLPMQ